MILDQNITLTLQPNVMPHYKQLGYDVKFRQKITVPWGHLPKTSGLKVSYSCDICESIHQRAFNKLHKKQMQICSACVKKENALYRAKNPTQKLKEYRQKLSEKCGDKHYLWNPNREEFKRYSSRVHNESDRTYNKYITEINPKNYPRTKCGVVGGYQLDHKFSIKDAFLNGWSIQECSNKENLQMLPWLENNLKAKTALINRNRSK